MLSVTCKAAVKAVIYLASKFETGEKSGIKEIADYINENEHTVGKLLQKLVKENIINSNKGPKGGFFISKTQMHQKIIKIVESIDGNEVFTRCGLGIDKCSEKRPCAFHDEYKSVRQLFEKMCNNSHVCDLYQKVKAGTAFLG